MLMLTILKLSNRIVALVRIRRIASGKEDRPDWVEVLTGQDAGMEKLMQVWDGQHSANQYKNCVELAFLLAAVFRTTTRVTSDGEDLRHTRWTEQTAQHVAKEFLQRRMKFVYSHLSSGQGGRAKSTLHLLTSIANLGRVTTRKLIDVFDWKFTGFQRLARPDTTGKWTPREQSDFGSARMFFVKWVLSLLENADIRGTIQILSARQLVGPFLGHVGADPEELQLQILKFVACAVLSINHKLPAKVCRSIFSEGFLSQLVLVTSQDTDHLGILWKNSTIALKSVATIGTFLLVEACTSTEHGLLSNVKSESSLVEPGAKRLLRALHLLQYNSFVNHLLILKFVLKEVPVLSVGFLATFPQTVEPRLSQSWFTTISLLGYAVKCARGCSLPFHGIIGMHGMGSAPVDGSNLRSLLRRIIPKSVSRSSLSRGLQHSSALVSFATLVLLENMLKTASHINQSLEREWNSSSSEAMSRYFQLLHVKFGCALKESIPDPQVIVGIHQAVSQAGACVSEGKQQMELLKVQMASVLCLYSKVLPNSLELANVDPRGILIAEAETANLCNSSNLYFSRLLQLNSVAGKRKSKGYTFDSKLFSMLVAVSLNRNKTTTVIGAETLCANMLAKTGIFGCYTHLSLLCINSLLMLGSKDAVESGCDFLASVILSTVKGIAQDEHLQHQPAMLADPHCSQILHFCRCCLSNFLKVNESKKIGVTQKLQITVFIALLHVDLLRYSNCRIDVANLIITKLETDKTLQTTPADLIENCFATLLKCLISHAKWAKAVFGDEQLSKSPHEGHSPSGTVEGCQPTLTLLEIKNVSTGLEWLTLLACSPADVRNVLLDHSHPHHAEVTRAKFLQGYLRLHAGNKTFHLLDAFLNQLFVATKQGEVRSILGKRYFAQYSSDNPYLMSEIETIADIPTCLTLLLTSDSKDDVFSCIWENIHSRMLDLHPVSASFIVGSMGFWLQLTLKHSLFSDEKKCYSLHALFDVLEQAVSCLPEDLSAHLQPLLVDGIWKGIQLHDENTLLVKSVLFRQLASFLVNIHFTSTEHHEKSLDVLNVAHTQLLWLLESSQKITSKDLQAVIGPLVDILSYSTATKLQQFWKQAKQKRNHTRFHDVAVSFFVKVFKNDRLANIFLPILDHEFLDIVMRFLDELPTEGSEECVCTVLSYIFSSDWELTMAFWENYYSKLYDYCTKKPFTGRKGALFKLILEKFPIMLDMFDNFLLAVLEESKGMLPLSELDQLVSCFALPAMVCLRALKHGRISEKEGHVISYAEECITVFISHFKEYSHAVNGRKSCILLLDVFQELQTLQPHSKLWNDIIQLTPGPSNFHRMPWSFDSQQDQMWIKFGQLFRDRGKQTVGSRALKVLDDFCKFFNVYLEGKCTFVKAPEVLQELCCVGIEICQHLTAANGCLDISSTGIESLTANFDNLIKTSFHYIELCSFCMVFVKELFHTLHFLSADVHAKSNLTRSSWEVATGSDTFMQMVTQRQEKSKLGKPSQVDGYFPVPLDMAPDVLKQQNQRIDVQSSENSKCRSHCLLFLLGVVETFVTADSNWSPHPDPAFFAALLSSYNATVDDEDRLVHRILQCVDSTWGGQYFSGNHFQFGSNAQSLAAGEVFCKLVSLLDLIDAQQAALSMLYFPIDIAAADTRGTTSCSHLGSKNCRSESTLCTDIRDAHCIYDPSFMLRLAQHRLEKGVKIQELASCGLLGIALSATSSKDRTVRQMAYNCLGNVMDLLETEDFKEKTQLSLMLIHVKNSIPEPFYEVPSLFSLFWANCSVIALHPEHWLYPEINRYFLKSAVEDFKRVPMFFKMIHSGKVSHKEERKWMLFLVKFGLRAREDGVQLRKQFGIELLLSLCNSSLIDDSTKMQIVDIVHRATQIKSVALDLIEHAGLIPWLGQAFVECSHRMQASTIVDFPVSSTRIILCILDILTQLANLVTEGGAHLSLFVSYCTQLLEVSCTILASIDHGNNFKNVSNVTLHRDVVSTVHSIFLACSKDRRTHRSIAALIPPGSLQKLLTMADNVRMLDIVVLIPVESYGYCSGTAMLLEFVLAQVKGSSHIPNVCEILTWLAKAAPACNTINLAKGLACASLHVFSIKPYSMQTTDSVQNVIFTILPALKVCHNEHYLEALDDLAKLPFCCSTALSQPLHCEQLGRALRTVVRAIDWHSIKQL